MQTVWAYVAVPVGDFGTDVQGSKPILFDVGKDERKMEEALKECLKLMGDKDVTVLYDMYGLPASVEKMVKEEESKVKEERRNPR